MCWVTKGYHNKNENNNNGNNTNPIPKLEISYWYYFILTPECRSENKCRFLHLFNYLMFKPTKEKNWISEMTMSLESMSFINVHRIHFSPSELPEHSIQIYASWVGQRADQPTCYKTKARYALIGHGLALLVWAPEWGKKNLTIKDVARPDHIKPRTLNCI